MLRKMFYFMRQYELVIEAMADNGGFATLGFLNQHVDVSNWKTKTPFATIRRIVQNEQYFFNIKPGLWALKTFKDKLPANIFSEVNSDKTKIKEFHHSYYQGLLVEIGNMKAMQTFIPYQDKNKLYLNKKLGDISSIKEFYKFSYENFVKKAITIDVTWFNARKMPDIFLR